MEMDSQLKVRPRNWLPLPGVGGEAVVEVEEPQVVDEADMFSKATIKEYYPKQGYGYLVTDAGEKVKFDLKLISLVGSKVDPGSIKVGMRVGYDLGKTSRGPLVCTLKIY